MLVLAVDTATPAVTAGLVTVSYTGASEDPTWLRKLPPPGPPGAPGEQPAPGHHDVHPLASRVTVDARAHNEVLTPQILECLDAAGRSRAELDAVVVGLGPGPFTGLRVGMATAAAFGDALGLPVYGVCSLDAIAAAAWSDIAAADAELLVVTDARRREVYWARYRAVSETTPEGSFAVADGRGAGAAPITVARVSGPEVCKPADLESGDSTVIAGSASHVDFFDLPVLPVETPSPVGLVVCAAADLLSRATPEPLTPLYLRRPDAVERSYQAVRS